MSTSSIHPFRPERALLLSCARTSANEETANRIRTLAKSGIDWEYLFLLARRHSVLPLLYFQLQRQASNLVPEEHLHRLRQHYRENAARNVVLFDELCRLISLFAEAGIEAIPYKGPVLALFAYGDLALRRFVDLDVMVRKEDVLSAREVLLGDGYQPAKSLTVSQQQVLLRTQHNMQFTKNGRRLIVELHWEVASHLFASSVQAAGLWRDLAEFAVNGVTLRTLSADDLLFSLCVHGSRHLWERLAWICDVAELITRQVVDWTALLDRAAKTDNERIIFVGLRLAQDLLGLALPPKVAEMVERDRRVGEVAMRISERLFNGAEHVPASPKQILKYNLDVRKSWRARARYCVFMLRPTDGDLSAFSVPAGLGVAYYLMRPFRLLHK